MLFRSLRRYFAGLERDGVGLLREQGYGRVVVGHPLLLRAIQLTGSDPEIPSGIRPVDPRVGRPRDRRRSRFPPADETLWAGFHQLNSQMHRKTRLDPRPRARIRRLAPKEIISSQSTSAKRSSRKIPRTFSQSQDFSRNGLKIGNCSFNE